ncbi:MAG TPA: DUF5916 domain-containing protein, partial [Saprospiraceae bacterium]|nr:DUF5916 domain-containing protein [Saprospiraceae bacterium]
MKAKHLSLLAWALSLCPLLVSAQKNVNADRFQMRIRPSTVPIKLDGLLDEAAWQTEGPADHFKFIFPNDTAYSKWHTEARLTFDERNLYIGVVCHERRQDYTVQSLRRDFGPGTTDVINVMFDPTKDGLNGFMFGVSPYNVQRDALIANGDSPAYEWDNKWYSAVQNYDDRWTVEIAIPFKTLRYNVAKGENSWGIQFIRTKLKDFETSVWAPTPFQYRPTNLAFCGRLVWETPPPKPGANISLIPYAIGGAALDYVRDPKTLDLTQRNLDWTGNVGGDAKIAITPGLNLDLTVNPDFSQVEVDQQVANLSRFELFFPEVRQFFLENRDLFALYGFPSTRPFFSRRIGLARNPRTGFNQKIPILAGARLSGKLNDNWRIGFLNMQTQRRDWDSLSVLPAANFTVATVQRKVFQRSIVSGVLVNKQNFLGPLNETQRKGWQPYNRVAGLEGNLYSQDNRWEGEWYYHRSLSPDPKQRGATLASFLGYRDRYFNAFAGYNRVDSTYRAEAGFVPRPGVQALFLGLGGRAYPKQGWAARHITNYALEANGDLTYGLNGQSTDRDLSVNLSATFKDQTYVGLVGFQTYVYLFEPFDPTNLRLEGA